MRWKFCYTNFVGEKDSKWLVLDLTFNNFKPKMKSHLIQLKQNIFISTLPHKVKISNLFYF